MSLTLGEARSFSARAVDDQGNPVNATLFWSSENAAIATVSNAGVVTAIGVGSTRIAANAGGKASVATVNVSDRPVSSVRVSPSTTRIEVGSQSTLIAGAFDAGGLPLLGLTASWATANPNVATIDNAGVVTAVAAGVATVSATIAGASGTAVIHVDDVPVASLRVTPATGAVLEGGTLQLNAEAVDGAGKVLPGRVIAWRSSAVSVASVSSDGLVVGFTAGSATITATSEGRSGTATIAVSPIPVAAIEVTPGSVIVSAGNAVQFTALARDKNGNVLNRPLTWTSDQPAVATVSSNGLASALQPGTARLTATAEGKSGSATLTINPIPVASVTITPATRSLQTGDTTSLAAVTRDAAGNVLPGRLVTWLSGAPNVTSVSSAGLVTAVGTGSAIVFATSEGVSGTSAINVTAPPAGVASISVSPTVLVVQPGGTRPLTATVRDAAGNVLTGRTVTWSTSTANVATVSATGVVTAITDGATTITASNGSVTGSATVSVVTPVSSVTVAPAAASLLAGATRQFSAIGRDDAGNVLPGRAYTWISSAASVATVSNNGLVTAVGAGTATISAYTGGLSGAATVTVTVPAPVIASIDVTPSTATLQPNDLQPLVAVAKDAAGAVMPNQAFVWSSSATGVATVSATGAVTAIGAGTATIRASSGGVDGTATIMVTAAPIVVA
ncbi:MAG: Ig-like domain-containing protein, partial [Cytophagaceae bacterium]|nr:Ig-like domain-containing protein [Gemmatimonadaceae bacterium]